MVMKPRESIASEQRRIDLLDEWAEMHARACYDQASREHTAAVRAAEIKSFEAYKARMDAYDLREQLAAEEGVRMLYTFAAVVTALVLLGMLLGMALPAHAEPAALTAARTAQVTCVQREYRTRTASTGVTATEVALVARAQAEHVCALEAWSRALGAAAEVRVVTATRAPVMCEPNLPTSSESCRGERPTWIDVLSHGGACALCGGGVALGAWAACGGVR